MKIVFFRVDNSKDYDRYTFDDNSEEEVLDKLSLLKEEEYRVYDMNTFEDAFGFQEDYNDEILDGGWWCYIIKN